MLHLYLMIWHCNRMNAIICLNSIKYARLKMKPLMLAVIEHNGAFSVLKI